MNLEELQEGGCLQHRLWKNMYVWVRALGKGINAHEGRQARHLFRFASMLLNMLSGDDSASEFFINSMGDDDRVFIGVEVGMLVSSFGMASTTPRIFSSGSEIFVTLHTPKAATSPSNSLRFGWTRPWRKGQGQRISFPTKPMLSPCLLHTSDPADEQPCV